MRFYQRCFECQQKQKTPLQLAHSSVTIESLQFDYEAFRVLVCVRVLAWCRSFLCILEYELLVYSLCYSVHIFRPAER